MSNKIFKNKSAGRPIVQGLGDQMQIYRSTHKARVRIANPPSVAKEFAELFYWIETQVDTSGGRHFESLSITKQHDGQNIYLVSSLTLGWLHGPEDRILMDVAKEIKAVSEKPVIEIDYKEPKT